MLESCHTRMANWGDLAMVLAWRKYTDVRRFMFTQHKIVAVKALHTP